MIVLPMDKNLNLIIYSSFQLNFKFKKNDFLLHGFTKGNTNFSLQKKNVLNSYEKFNSTLYAYSSVSLILKNDPL